jgi:hypothetical protein
LGQALTILLGETNCVRAIEPILQIEGSFSLIEASGRETHWSDFSLILSGKQFRVSNVYFNGETLINGSDGTNSYFVNKMTKSKQVITNWWEWGRVSAGQFPQNDLVAGQLCWIAFASSHYFEARTNFGLPLESFQQNATFLHCDAMLSTNQPRLPLSIKWYGSNFFYLHAKNESKKVRLPYTNGYLAGDYFVSSVTNFASFAFPLSFAFEIFIPTFMGTDVSNRDVTDVRLVQVLKGSVHAIKPLENIIKDFRPQLGLRAQIADFRIPSTTNGIYFQITRLNGKWPEPTDSDFARTFGVARMAINPKASPVLHKFPKIIVVSLMISSFLVFIMITKITTNKQKPMKGKEKWTPSFGQENAEIKLDSQALLH